MRARSSVFAGLLAALLLVVPLAYAQSNKASYGPVEFYTDKASYLPGETVKFTIIIKNRPNFKGQIDVYISRNGNLEYLYHYPSDNGTVIVFKLKTVDGNSVITFEKKFDETGVYEAKIAIPELNVPANAVTIQFSVAPSYQITGKVVDENGKPVAGAVVVVKTLEKKPVASTTTMENGTFAVSVPGPGTYIVCAKANRYLKNTTKVVVNNIGITDAGTIVIESIDHAIATIRKQLYNISMQLGELRQDLDKKYNEYVNAMQTLQDILSKMNTRITGLENNISALSESLGRLSAAVENIDNELKSLKNDYSQFKDNTQAILNDLNNKVGSLSDKVNEIDQRLSKVEQSYATKDEVQKLQSQVNQLNKQLGNLAGKVDNLEQATIKQLSNQLNDLTNKLDKLSNDIAGASRTAMIAVVLAVIGIVIAIVAVVSVYRRIA